MRCRGRIQKIAAEQDGVVLVTWANFQYLDFVQNWLSHMRKIKVTTYLVGAMDEELLQASSAPSPLPRLISKMNLARLYTNQSAVFIAMFSLFDAHHLRLLPASRPIDVKTGGSTVLRFFDLG